MVPARRLKQVQPCNAIVAPAHVRGWCEGMRREAGWAEARAHDASMTTERSDVACTAVGSSIDDLCARVGSDCRFGGTCGTCHG